MWYLWYQRKQGNSIGAVGGLVGLGGGAAGTSFSGPQGTNIIQTANAGQADTAYTQNQAALQQQQQLLQAIQAQGGLQNQSNVYNQLQNVAAGQGPNPAQAQLAQATGQNVQNQAALMAGQRGAGANVGLIARQAAQQGANTQQQAAGQAATMQANQSLNAINSAGNIANTQAANQIGATSANTQANQGEQANVLNAINAQNQNNIAMQSNINNANAGLANTQMQGQQSLIGGTMQGLSGASGMMGAGGGAVVRMAYGGVNSTGAGAQLGSMGGGGTNAGAAALQAGAKSTVGRATKKDSNAANGNPAGTIPTAQPGSDNFIGPTAPGQSMGPMQPAAQAMGSGGTQMPASSMPDSMMAARGGKVPALVSPGERYLRPQEAQAVAKGQASPMRAGEKIPGKAKVKGNSYANDTVPKNLDEGGVVIPRSVMESKNPEKQAAKFVAAALAKSRLPRG